METNAVEVMRALLDQSRSDEKAMVVIVGMIIAALAPTLMAFAGYLKSRSTANEVVKIHLAVNSERTAMTAEVKSLRDEVRRLAVDKSTLQEEKRGAELAAARAEPVPVKDVASHLKPGLPDVLLAEVKAVKEFSGKT